MKALIMRAFLASLLFIVVDGKIEQTNVALTSLDCDVFLTKFSFSPGVVGKVAAMFSGIGRAYVEDSHLHNLILALYDDEAWPKYLASLKTGSLCPERIALATTRKTLRTGNAPVAHSKNTPIVRYDFVIDETFGMITQDDTFLPTPLNIYIYKLSVCLK